MSKLPAVIFDMDGVLVDSYEAHYESWIRLARERGFEFSRETFLTTFGRVSREVIVECGLLEEPTPESVAEIDDAKEAHFRDILREDFRALRGAPELIDALAAEGHSLAVGSSGPPENVDLVIDLLGRRHQFKAVVTARDVTQGKPHPQVFLKAAAGISAEPANCVVVEDAQAGIAAAHAAGMVCIGLVSAGHTTEELSAADHVVQSLEELSPEIIHNIWMEHKTS